MKKILFLSLVLAAPLSYSMLVRNAIAATRKLSSKPWIYNPRLNQAITELTQLQKQIKDVEAQIQQNTPNWHDDYVYERSKTGSWILANEQPRVKEMLEKCTALRDELAQLHDKLTSAQEIYKLERKAENDLNNPERA
jgi:hypothetical protein